MKHELATFPANKPISTSVWGNVDGHTVYLYTLTNGNGTRLTLSNYGAIIQSLFVTGSNGDVTDVVLGYDTPEEYKKDPYYMGCVVGRYCNRIATGTVYLEGIEYAIHTTDGGYHLHGGASGFNKKVWSAELLEKNAVRMSYLSVDGEEGFPGNLDVHVTYRLTEQDEVSVEYTASTDKTTLVNLTQHSYFNLAGHNAGSALTHELQIFSTWYLPVNSLQVPAGIIKPVSGTAFDFRSPKLIGKDIENEDDQLKLSSGYDHSWVLEKKHTPRLKHAATVKDTDSGRVMNLYTTEPAVHLYTANFISEGTKGRDGAVYNKRNSFCLETQHFPDAPNHEHFPCTVLHPGESFYSKTVFKFSVSE